ncbi:MULTISPECIES: YncE family protein [unclassified Pseudomonas]|uniref:YncE family protein n=3 Tax=Pseudomonas TaxID=286 RepID=UPI001A92B1D8|nr:MULTISPECIES: hypothetical protein [unclassified Pseudomonas]
MTYDQNPPSSLPYHCLPTGEDHNPPPALPHGCVATVPRKKPNKTPVGRLPDRRPMGGCPPGAQRLPSTQLPFADLIPYIPNLTPIPGTDGALNKAALTVSALGVIYILYAWFEQAENDFVWVELNGETVAHYTVSADDAVLGKDITLTIQSVRFIDQAYNKLQGFVKRLSGVTDETTALNIWVDQKEPGGVDPQVSTPLINENLGRIRFVDSNIEAFGIITQAAAQNGIKIFIDRYPVNPLVDPVHDRKEGDVIFVSIGGVLVTHKVTSFEASSNAPIVITINYGTWLQVTLGVNIFEWFVRDKAGNQSNGFSVPRLIQNNVNGSTGPLLPAAHVLEADYDGDSDEDFIDTDVQSKDLRVEIPIRIYGWLSYDKAFVTYLGLTATGETLKHTEMADVPQPNALRIYVPLPLEFAKKLAGGRLLITYERVREGEVNTPSNAVIYSMRGTPVDNSRPAPIVHGLEGGVLPLGTDPVEITVRFFGQNPSDKLDLIIEGTALDGTPVYAKYTDSAGTGAIDFFLDYQSVFALLEGSTFKAYYVVNNDTSRPSKSVTVSVGDITVTLPPPTSDDLRPGHVFDELFSKGNLKALVHPHSSIALNDEVRVVATGSKPGGSFTTAWLEVTSIWFGSALTFTIPRAIVLANKDSTMAIHWEVRTLPTDTPLKSLPLIVNVGAKLKLTECPSLLEGTYVSPCLTQLNPLHVWTPSPRTVTFRIKYPMLATDLVTLVIQGKPGLGMPSIPAKPGVPDAGHDYITFALLSNFVAAYVGDSFTAYVEVLRNGEVFKSPALTVNVDALSAQTLDLVSVPEALGGVIDTSQSNSVEVKAWPFFNRQQAVFIRLKSSTDLFLRPGIKVSAAEFTAQRTHDLIHDSYLKGLANGATVTVDTSVSLDEAGIENSAIKLKSVAYRINRQPVVSKHIIVGAGEHEIVITKDSKTAFVNNRQSKTVSVIDIEKALVVHTIQTPKSFAISLNNDDTKLLITVITGYTSASNLVAAYDTASYALLKQTLLHYKMPYGITGIKGTGTYAYTSTQYFNDSGGSLYEIAKINTQTGNVEKYIPTGTGEASSRLWISPENVIYSWLGNWGVRRLDTSSDAFISSAPFPSPVSDIAFSNTDNKGFYVSGSSVGTFDRLLNKIINTNQGFNYAVGVATHPFEALLYLTENGTDKVHIFDTSEDQPKLVNTLSGFNGPQFLQVTPNGKHLLVSNYRSSTIALVDL